MRAWRGRPIARGRGDEKLRGEGRLALTGRAARLWSAAMSKKDAGAPPAGRNAAAKPPNGKAMKRQDREARLAAALRANLRRRKGGKAKD